MIKLQHFPNCLTLLRIAIIPLLVLTYYLPYGYITATALFAVACITDWLDGYLARAMGLTSRLGAFLDPVADKLLIVAALILVLGKVPYITIPAIIIIGREIVISALREWMAEMGKRASIAVTYVAKIKTGIQMLALGFLLFGGYEKYHWVIWPAYVFIYMAAILTLWTMLIYLKISWSCFKEAA